MSVNGKNQDDVSVYKKCNVSSSIKVDIRRLILMSFELKVFHDIGHSCCSPTPKLRKVKMC